MKFDERNQNFKKILHFLFPSQLWQSLFYRFRFFLAYLVPLDVNVTGNKIGIGWTYFAAVAMETKKGRFKKI
jgi:hypothetical protein